MAPATRKAYGASTSGQSQAAQPGSVRRAGPRGARQVGGVREDRPYRGAVTGPTETAETGFRSFRSFRKRYANQGPQSSQSLSELDPSASSGQAARGPEESLLGARHSSGAHRLCDPRRCATEWRAPSKDHATSTLAGLLGALSGAGNIGGRNIGHRRRACRVF
jgi:hypothetical protein